HTSLPPPTVNSLQPANTRAGARHTPHRTGGTLQTIRAMPATPRPMPASVLGRLLLPPASPPRHIAITPYASILCKSPECVPHWQITATPRLTATAAREPLISLPRP